MSTINPLLKINGVVSTDKTVLQNLNDLCSASGCWLTYDIADGKWSVIINKPGTSVASFSNSNIIGNIDVSGTGVTELYNAVSVEFPHQDLRDTKDYVDLEIPSIQRFPNEITNTLNIQYDNINDPIHAQYLANVELKQSRVDKVIEFRTDYSYIGLKAGDLIDVTSEMYGFTSKVFRIIKVAEDDTDGIQISITALEYDTDVYNVGSLTRLDRNKKTGIILKSKNPAVQASETVDFGAQMARMLAANAGLSLLNKLFTRLVDGQGNPLNIFEEEDKDLAQALQGVTLPKINTITAFGTACEGDSISVTVSHNCVSNCFFTVPELNYNYEITGVAAGGISIPLTGTLAVPATSTGASGTLTFDTIEGFYEGDKTITVKIGELSRSINVFETTEAVSYVTTASPTSITEGESTTITFTSSEITNATVSYTITGSAQNKISTPLTGNITVTNGTGTLVVATTDDSVFTGTQSFLVTINAGVTPRPCGGNYDFVASVVVLDNDTAPPEPPPDLVRQYVLTPIVWGGTYDGATGQLKFVSVLRNAFMPLPFPGEPTVQVPTVLTIIPGSPSLISISASRAISTVSTLGGTLLEPITAFNPVPANTAITGTRAAIYGYY
jgi:hypothetical protein